jgi:hypothetical protein
MKTFIFVHVYLFGVRFWGRDWGAMSPKRGTRETCLPNARSSALWGTRLDMLLYCKLEPREEVGCLFFVEQEGQEGPGFCIILAEGLQIWEGHKRKGNLQ